MSFRRMLDNSTMVKKFAEMYCKATERRLKALGLRWDDLTNEGDSNYARALKMLPDDVLEARIRRMNRAIDLSCKHKELSPAGQAASQTWAPYVRDLYDDLKARKHERETYN